MIAHPPFKSSPGSLCETLVTGAACLLVTAGASASIPVLTIQSDASLALISGPHVAAEITRDRYFRLYHFPGMFSDELAAEMRYLRVSPARGTGPYLKDHGGDTKRLGWAQDVASSVAQYAELYRNAPRQHPGATHAIAGGSYPTCRPMEAQGAVARETDATMYLSHDRSLAPEQFDATAEVIESWFDGLKQAGVSKPRYFSPFNEPDVSWKSGPDRALRHADFARTLAIRLRARHPDVLVAGPCTSWPYPGEDWRRWSAAGWERAFIERVGDVAGAYDFHFYTKEFWAYGKESPGFRSEARQSQPNLHASLWAGHHQVLDFGKGEGLLDLTQSLHLSKWNRPTPPVILSEFGRQGITPQLGPWANDYLSYLYGTTVTRLWMMLMNRPEVALTVPFILPVSDAGYGPRRGQALYTRPNAPDDKTPVVTPLRDFYAFFRDFEGIRTPAIWSGLDPRQEIGVFTIAARKGETQLLLLHNASIEPLEFDLKLSGETIQSAIPPHSTIQRMRWEGPIPGDHRTPSVPGGTWRRDLHGNEILQSSRLRLEGEETALIRFSHTPEPSRRVVVSRTYAPENLQSLTEGTEATFNLNVPAAALHSKLASAELSLVFAAKAGGTEGQHLEVRVNGQALSSLLPLDLLMGWRHPVHPFRLEFDPRLLVAGMNQVAVRIGKSGTPPGSKIVSARLDLRHEYAP